MKLGIEPQINLWKKQHLLKTLSIGAAADIEIVKTTLYNGDKLVRAFLSKGRTQNQKQTQQNR